MAQISAVRTKAPILLPARNACPAPYPDVTLSQRRERGAPLAQERHRDGPRKRKVTPALGEQTLPSHDSRTVPPEQPKGTHGHG
jgi:hypothetical protein